MSTIADQDDRRRKAVQRMVDKLAPHIDIRCVPCGGTGVSIASQHDCRACGGTGLAYGEMGRKKAATLAREILAEVMAHATIVRLDDAAAIAPVMEAAVALCRDSLGDDALWAATTPLREALDAWNGEPVSSFDDVSSLSTNDDSADE